MATHRLTSPVTERRVAALRWQLWLYLAAAAVMLAVFLVLVQGGGAGDLRGWLSVIAVVWLVLAAAGDAVRLRHHRRLLNSRSHPLS
ncbi:hypothetical protein ACFV3R_29735 [Streptomyces sp. NPDC059740]|uniref:hypothetical protein n=1 Tax=Streptomyces sp. NPDC059740 TaxID=3346926 RepID=UPI0036653D6D